MKERSSDWGDRSSTILESHSYSRLNVDRQSLDFFAQADERVCESHVRVRIAVLERHADDR